MQERPIVVRFVRRDTKIAMMKKKKTLRNIDRYRNTFVEDDLIPNMLRVLKLDEQVKRVWTIDGSFHCIVMSNRKARRLGLIRQSTQSLSNGCSRTVSLYSRNSWYVFVPLWKKSWSRTVVLRWHARNALVHLPVMMSATPPKATMSSISTHDAFISVPMHPRNDISVCIIPGCNTSDVQQ